MLERAEQRIRDLYTTRISNVAQQYLLNDNRRPYEGAPHEQLYLNLYKALNYLALEQPDSARVEARRLDEKLVQMVDRYQWEASEYREAARQELEVNLDPDSYGQPSVENPEFHSSALARFLGYVVYMHEGNPDSVRIEHDNMREAFANQPNMYPFAFPDLPRHPPNDPNRVPMFFLADLGQGPYLRNRTVRVPLPPYNTHFVMRLPEMVPRGTNVKTVRLQIRSNNETIRTLTLEPLEDVNRIGQNTFDLKYPITAARTFIRAASKTIATNRAASYAQSQGGDAARVLADIGGFIYRETSEQADLRIVRTLPAQFQVGTVQLAPGSYRIEAKFLSNQNQVLYRQTRQVQVSQESLDFVRWSYFR